jgi:hypothetical protein
MGITYGKLAIDARKNLNDDGDDEEDDDDGGVELFLEVAERPNSYSKRILMKTSTASMTKPSLTQ